VIVLFILNTLEKSWKGKEWKRIKGRENNEIKTAKKH
jgi:hypothetical protein